MGKERGLCEACNERLQVRQGKGWSARCGRCNHRRWPTPEEATRLARRDPTVRGQCVDCGERPQSSAGTRRFRLRCTSCHYKRFPAVKANARRRSRLFHKPWTAFKKDRCEHCGAQPEALTMLDVDHIDGDRNNNDPRNLQTLCKPCHVIKTRENGEVAWRFVHSRKAKGEARQ